MDARLGTGSAGSESTGVSEALFLRLGSPPPSGIHHSVTQSSNECALRRSAARAFGQRHEGSKAPPSSSLSPCGRGKLVVSSASSHIWALTTACQDVCINTHIYIYAHLHIHTYMPMYAYMYTYIHITIYTYTRAYTYSYIHIYIYLHIHICVHIHIHIYACIHTYVHICTSMCAYTYICAYIYTYVPMRACTYMCAYICIYIYLHMYTYVQICICMYTCAYIHIYITYACTHEVAGTYVSTCLLLTQRSIPFHQGGKYRVEKAMTHKSGGWARTKRSEGPKDEATSASCLGSWRSWA